jgi:hypothetical protein
MGFSIMDLFSGDHQRKECELIACDEQEVQSFFGLIDERILVGTAGVGPTMLQDSHTAPMHWF